MISNDKISKSLQDNVFSYVVLQLTTNRVGVKREFKFNIKGKNEVAFILECFPAIFAGKFFMGVSTAKRDLSQK